MAGPAQDKDRPTVSSAGEQHTGHGSVPESGERGQRIATDAEFGRAADYVFRRYAALYKRLA